MKLSAEDKQIVKEYGSYLVNTGGNDPVELGAQ